MKKNMLLSIILLLLIAVVAGRFATRYLVNHDNYEQGHAAYIQGDCDAALGYFNRIVFSDLGGYSKAAAVEKEECLAYQSAVNLYESDDLSQAFNAFYAFTRKYTGSSLIPLAHAHIIAFFEQSTPFNFASLELCQEIDGLLDAELIPHPTINIPLLYVACGQLYENSGQLQDSYNMYTYFLATYSEHPLLPRVKAGLLGNPLICESLASLQDSPVATVPDILPSFYYVCGRAYEDIKEYDRAIAAFESLIRHYPNHPLSQPANGALQQVETEMEELYESIDQAIAERQTAVATSLGLSFTPVIGDFKDIIEAIVGEDLVTGDRLSVGERAAIAVITIYGAGAGLTHADELADLGRYSDELLDIGRYGDEAVDLVRYSDEFSEFMVRHSDEMADLARYSDELTEFFAKHSDEIADLSRYSDEVAELAARHSDDLAMARYVGDCSFSAETLVLTDEGKVEISNISPGSNVLAYHEETNNLDYYPVIATWANEDPFIVYLTISGEVIATTPEHLFYINDGYWMEASSLEIGDTIHRSDSQMGSVESIVTVYNPQPMYNFSVDVAHTYFVGQQGWLVHNDCSSKKLAENILRASGEVRPADVAAHHIVACNDPRAAEARRILADAGIDLNEAINGVFLPRNTRVPNPTGANVHSTLHTRRYYEEITERLLSVRGRRLAIEDVLEDIRFELLNGIFPH